EVGVPTTAVTFRVHQNVAFLFTRAIHNAVSQELESLKHLAFFADDASRVAPNDFNADFVGAVSSRTTQLNFAVHLHVLDHMSDEFQSHGALLVGRFDDLSA